MCHTSKGMRIYHIPRASTVAMLKTVLKVAKFRFVKNKRQVNAFILCRDTKPHPLSFSAQKPLKKRLSMHRYGVSESGIVCKGNEKIDYLYLFHGLFLAVRIKTDVWAHKEDLLRPNTPFSSFLNLNSKLAFQKASLIFATSSSGLKSSILEKAN